MYSLAANIERNRSNRLKMVILRQKDMILVLLGFVIVHVVLIIYIITAKQGYYEFAKNVKRGN